MAPRIYKKGTSLDGGLVSIDTGESAFVGTGTMFNGADLEGAELWIYPVSGEPYFVGHVAAIEPRYPDGGWPSLGPITLAFPWLGAPIVEQPFLLLLSAATVPSSLGTTLLGRFTALLEKAGLFWDGRDVEADEVTDFTTRALYYDPVSRLLKSWRGGMLESVDVVGSSFDPVGPWVYQVEDKASLAIVTGDAAVNASLGAIDVEGVRHFKLIADEAVEIQLPTNVEVGDRLFIEIVMDGSHAVTFAMGYTANDIEIVDEDGATTLIAIEVDAETGGTATAATVTRWAYDKNDLVSRGGFAFVSNIDDNISEPQIEYDAPESNSFWTALPVVQGQRGDAGLAGFAYVFDDSTDTGTNPDPGFTRVNNPDLSLVTSIALALLDDDGVNRQDQLESYAIDDRIQLKIRDGSAVFAEYRLTAAPTIVSSRAVLTVTLIDKMAAFLDGDSLDIVFGERGPPGEQGIDGTDPGVLLTWDDGNTDTDPGSGNIRADLDALGSATFLYVSKENRAGDDISAWLAALAGSTNANKGTITITRSGGNAQALFHLTGVTVEADYVKLAVSNHAGTTGFLDNQAVSLQFARTGDDAVVVGDVSSVNGETGDVILEAGDILTDPDGTFDGDSVEVVLDDHDARIVDAEADISGLESDVAAVEADLASQIATVTAQLNRAVRVRVVAAGNVNISNGLENGDSLGGVTLQTGDHILLPVQSAPAQNGLYTVVASGAASRTTGYTTFAAFMGLLISVDAGDGAGQLWHATSAVGGTLGSNDLVFEQIGAGGASSGLQTMYIPATRMVSRQTNGPSASAIETASNRANIYTLSFDATTAEFAQFEWRPPKGWDKGNIFFQAVWKHESTTTNFGVAWRLSGLAYTNDDTLDQAQGTAVTVTDTGGTTRDIYISDLSAAVTIANTPIDGDVAFMEVSRNPSNGSDTMAIDADLWGVIIFYNITTIDDT